MVRVENVERTLWYDDRIEGMKRPKKILIICKSGRLDCAAEAFYRSAHPKDIYILSEVKNPSLLAKAVDVHQVVRTDDKAVVRVYAEKIRPDFVFIGPEEPLAEGIVDALRDMEIPAIGPTKSLARLETSKSFARELLQKYDIPGNPKYRTFYSMSGLRPYLEAQKSFVVKPDGLTGGKGVKVFGEHLHSIEDAVDYCAEVFDAGQKAIVIEERLEGEEFSFQSFCDGRHVVHTIPVQDHKRAWNGDQGPNTGGMGSYSCEDHLLPFLKREDIEEASRINAAVARALLAETGEEYKGILYGSFILTKNGLRVIEYNARFGDPEIMNVLPLLDTDFIDVCEAIIGGYLDKVPITFKPLASVCKYLVPEGYPGNAVKGAEVRLNRLPPASDQLRIYYASINGEGGKLFLTGSRALAVVGIGGNLADAERIAEAAASKVEGPVFHRSDIGTPELVARRVAHIAELRGDARFPLRRVTHVG
jgi:phosphoribosylamine--glycine ligase